MMLPISFFSGPIGQLLGNRKKFHGRNSSQPSVSKLPLNDPKELESLGSQIICTISEDKPLSYLQQKELGLLWRYENLDAAAD